MRSALACLLAVLTCLANPARCQVPDPAGPAENGGEEPAATPPALPADRGSPERDEADPPPEPELPAWELFSDEGRAFDPLLADPREAQVRIGYVQTFEDGGFLALGFGGDLGIASGRFGEDRFFSLTARGLIATRFEFFSSSFDLINTDFIGGAAAGYRTGNLSFELFPYHKSSHLGDDIIDRGERTRINLSFEALRFLAAYEWNGLRVYGGPTVIARADPASLRGSVTLELGAEQRFQVMDVPFYAAVDLQVRDEPSWRANVAAQVGFELGNPLRVVKRQRLFIELFNGYSNLGQFFDESETYVLAGLGFTF